MKKFVLTILAVSLIISLNAFAEEYTDTTGVSSKIEYISPEDTSDLPEFTMPETILGSPEFSIPDERTVTVKINGNTVFFEDVAPIIINGSTMLPLRKISEEFGTEVYYQACSNDINLITMYRDKTLITFTNAKYFSVDCIIPGKWRFHKYDLSDNENEYVSIFFSDENGDAVVKPEPIIINDRTLIPLRLFSEAFGAKVDWDENTYTVDITIPEAKNVRTPEQIQADDKYTYQDAIKFCSEYLKQNSFKEENIETIVTMVNNLYNIKGKLYAFDISPFSDEYKYYAFYSDGTCIKLK